MEEIDITDMFRYFLNKYKFIFKFVLVFFIFGFLINALKFRIYYEADSKVIFLNTSETEIKNNTKLMNSYFALTKSDEFIDTVKKNSEVYLDNNKIKNSISLANDPSTNIITISIKGLDKNISTKVSNTVANEFVNSLSIKYPNVKADLLEYSNGSYLTSNIMVFKNTIVITMVGFILSLGVVFLIYYFDDKVRNKEQLKLLKLPILGIVKNKPKDNEIFRYIRTALDLSKKTILVTSYNKKEGKTYISTKLAESLIDLNKKVLVIDCGNNNIHKIYKVSNDKGLVDINNKNIEDLIKKTDISNLDIINFGEDVNKKELFTDEFNNKISKISNKYDYIILDGTHLKESTDSVILSKISDIVILVCKYNETKLKELELSKESILNVNSNITGVILNNVPKEDTFDKIKNKFKRNNIK